MGMKLFKYLKVNGSMIWGENELTKEMLAMVKDGRYDTIIDLHTMTQYDPDKNEWVEIDGTAY